VPSTSRPTCRPALAFLAVAALIRSDAPPEAMPTTVQTLGVLVVPALLVLAAMTRAGRPIVRTRTDVRGVGLPLSASGSQWPASST
jgi:hypothetical protein